MDFPKCNAQRLADVRGTVIA